MINHVRVTNVARQRYIGDPDMIDHCGLILGGLRPEPSLGRHADNVIIPLDLTQSHWSSGSPVCFPS
jgi:hypothetical protein